MKIKKVIKESKLAIKRIKLTFQLLKHQSKKLEIRNNFHPKRNKKANLEERKNCSKKQEIEEDTKILT